MALSVGQKLWFVPYEHRRNPPHDVTVTKVGRKWATLDNGHRIDVETWQADGGDCSSPGKCYPDRAAWENEQDRQAAWNVLRRAVGDTWRPPAGVTVEGVVEAMRLLGIGQGDAKWEVG
jgi:hypothetical protein